MAAVFGVLVLLPMYFLEQQIGRDQPPPITHPEFFYGFVGVALAWQAAFWVIGSDPVRFRPLMIPAVLEKASFSIAAFILYAQGRIHVNMLIAGSLDFALGVLFMIAYLRTPLPSR